MRPTKPSSELPPEDPVPEPGEQPVDDSIKELLRFQGKLAKEAGKSYFSDRFSGIFAPILPGTASIRFDIWAFVAALLLLAAAVPLALLGPDAVWYLIPSMVPILIFGVLWRSHVLAVLAILFALSSLGAGYGGIAYFKQQALEQKKHAEWTVREEQRLKADSVVQKELAEMKAAEDKILRDAEAVKAAATAKKAAEEADARRINANFDQTQAALEKKREAERAAVEQKRTEDAALLKKRADEEKARILREFEAEKARQAMLEKRAAQLELAKPDYLAKSLALDDLSMTLKKLETQYGIAREDMDKHQLVLDREASPTPPTKNEMERARKAHAEAKKTADELGAQLPQLRAKVATAKSEKEKAKALLEELSK